MTLHAKRMLEGAAVEMTEVSGLYSDSFREESIKEGGRREGTSILRMILFWPLGKIFYTK